MIKRMKNQKGMSLLEIIIAIGIVAGVGGMIMTQVFKSRDKANIKSAGLQITNLVQQVKMYKSDHKKYPSSLEDLVDDYIDEVPDDPWGGEYFYESPGSHANKKFEIWSAGPDEEEDTDDDITSWKKKSDE